MGTEGRRIKSLVRMMVGEAGVTGVPERSGERRSGAAETRLGLCNSSVAMSIEARCDVDEGRQRSFNGKDDRCHCQSGRVDVGGKDGKGESSEEGSEKGKAMEGKGIYRSRYI